MDKINENLNSLNEEKASLEEELKSLDSEKDSDRISEINENLNSLNEEIDTLDKGDEAEALKKTNARLFARAKKAEGFILQDGKWIKKPKIIKEEPAAVVLPPDEIKINEILDKRELETLDLSDELKKEVQGYAKLHNVPIRSALNSDYILFLKEKYEKEKRVDKASIGGSRNATTKKNYGEIKPEDIDLRTPEGKKEFEEFEEHISKELG